MTFRTSGKALNKKLTEAANKKRKITFFTSGIVELKKFYNSSIVVYFTVK